MTVKQSSTWSGRRIILSILLLPIMFLIAWECVHFLRFGDFFTYGYHVDLVEDHSDIGVPRSETAYRLRITNYTFTPLKFEGHRWPEGTMDGAITYHDRLEKWDQQSSSWRTIFDHGHSAKDVNTEKALWFGQSIYPSGSYEVATVEGIHPGDTIRIVAFTSFSNSKAGGNQHVFYSQPFKVRDRPGDLPLAPRTGSYETRSPIASPPAVRSRTVMTNSTASRKLSPTPPPAALAGGSFSAP